ncbi:MAG: HNH endonuclease [Candidatus Riflebacteria bacterium]|jgi:hypothetical protein|nr:HNH endonuclease [Candidatus Riflebacteria bacterium]
MDSKTIVWIKSGGRCAICNRYLLNENFGEVVSIGENAHIVGRSTEPGSPRGDAPLSESERDNPENLVLLCREDHKIIDKKTLLSLFTVKELTQMKKRHEARIRHLTNLDENRETAVIRFLAKVRGSVVSIDRSEAAKATVASEYRIPFYPISPTKDGIEIDCQSLANEGSETYYAAAKEMISEEIKIFYEAVRKSTIKHISVFAFARVPLLVFLGKVLDDTVSVSVYQRHRQTENWVWDNTTPAIDFQFSSKKEVKTSTEAVLIVNVSGTINLDEIPSELSNFSVFSIDPVGVSPYVDTIRNQASLKNFDDLFRKFLGHLEQTNKQIQRLHLFLAVPVSVAVTIGRAINFDVNPNLTIYEIVDQKRVPTMVLDK